MTELVGQSEFARILGARYGHVITRQAVNKMVGDLIPRRSDGLIDVADAVARMIDAGRLRIEADDSEEETGADATLAELKRQKLERETRLLDIRLEREMGRLVTVEDVEVALYDAGRAILSALEDVTETAEQVVAAAPDVLAVRQVLRARARAVAAIVADRLARLAIGEDVDDTDQSAGSGPDRVGSGADPAA